jgi:MoaA/NifB/PqqE/SkfB family radical SAM enzyme
MKRLEIELTTICNASCPICRRTRAINNGQNITLTQLTLEDIKSILGTQDLTETKIKLCGVLGDPLSCSALYNIVEYFLNEKHVKYIDISTNGGLKSIKYWKRLGSLSAESNGKFVVKFAIDGVTRNDYRVGVDTKKVWNNLNAFTEVGGYAAWQYIIFDYNKHEVALAKEISIEKNIPLQTRTAWRNDASEEEKEKYGWKL